MLREKTLFSTRSAVFGKRVLLALGHARLISLQNRCGMVRLFLTTRHNYSKVSLGDNDEIT
jgi:hypothetical protein